MTLRLLTAAVAATLAVGGLAGCRSHVGTAASVDGHRISESQVAQYLTPTGADASAVAAAKAQGQVAAPRAQVLQVLVQQQVFATALARNGGVPGTGVLSGVHDRAASVLLQTTLTGGALDRSLAKGLARSGIRGSFGPNYLRTLELEYTLISRRSLTKLSELVALVQRAHVSVSVSRRYGVWNPKVLGVDSSAGLPGFLTLQPTPGASSSAATP